jgi:hypothetical protein
MSTQVVVRPRNARKRRNKQRRPRRRNRNKRNKNKNKQKRGVYSNGIPLLATKPMLSDCTLLYARALANPFQSFPEMPCIPDWITLPSFKYRARVRGTFSTGTAGIGWVIFNPWFASVNNGANFGTNGSYPIYYTTSSFAGNTIDFAIAGGTITTTGVAGANSNSILNSNTLTATNEQQLRLVAAGIQVRYIGSDLYNSGRTILYRNANNTSIVEGAQASYMLSQDYSASVPVSRRAEAVTYLPDTPALMGYRYYSDFNQSINTGTIWFTNAGGFNAAIWVDGGQPTNPQSWEYEANAYFEVIGLNLPTTSSHSDAVGLSTVMNALPAQNPLGTPQQSEESLLANMYNALSESTSAIFLQGARALPSAAVAAGASLASHYLGTSFERTPRVTITDL